MINALKLNPYTNIVAYGIESDHCSPRRVPHVAQQFLDAKALFHQSLNDVFYVLSFLKVVLHIAPLLHPSILPLASVC
jgi:hypothetical protein